VRNPVAQTAFGPMVLAAVEQNEPPDRRLVDDDLADLFLPAPLRGLVAATRVAPIRRLMIRGSEFTGPGLWVNMACRKRFIDDKLEQALSDPQETLMNFYRYLGARLEESANRPGVFDTAGRIEGAQRLQSLTWEEVQRGRAIVGTPEMVADNLASLRDQLGLAGILAELNTGGLIPHERVMRSMQLLCEKVQPQLH